MQWLELLDSWTGNGRVELTELRVGHLRGAGWLGGCRGHVLPLAGELRVWLADAADAAAQLHFSHDDAGRPRLNGHDVAGLVRVLCGWLAVDSDQ